MGSSGPSAPLRFAQDDGRSGLQGPGGSGRALREAHSSEERCGAPGGEVDGRVRMATRQPGIGWGRRDSCMIGRLSGPRDSPYMEERKNEIHVNLEPYPWICEYRSPAI